MLERTVPRVTRLTLTDFRNYRCLRLDVESSFVALAGANGAGKTNLLEALSLFAQGRGLRGSAFEDMARQGGSGTWAAAIDLATVGGPVSLGTGWSSTSETGDGGQGARIVIVNGKVRRGSGAFGDYLRPVWLTPAMDRLFAGPAGDRRRFLDRFVQAFDPEHGARVAVFERVMRERNLLLAEPGADPAWLSSLEAHMAEAGIAIAAARQTAVDSLGALSRTLPRAGAFPWSEVAIEGEIEALLEARPAVQVEDEYRRLLAESRAPDRAAGRTLRGPHRSDLAVIHGPKSMPAGHCSTGEQKALLIGLILAQAHAVKKASGIAPVLLLDEVTAHLDRARREGLFDALHVLGCQSWMTGTDPELFAGIGADARMLRVEAGDIWENREVG